MILVLLLAIAFASDCPVYHCGETNSKACGEMIEDEFLLSDCSSGKECYTHDPRYNSPGFINNPSKCQKPDNPEVRKDLAPGEICLKGEKCFGKGKCVNGVCEAASSKVGACCRNEEGWRTYSSKHCAIGQYCKFDDETCQALNPIGDKCSYNFGIDCLFGSDCGHGGCHRLYSLEDWTDMKDG